MQAVILCGGKATRLYPVTINLPKSLIEINGKVFIEYQIELLKSHEFDNILLCTGIHGNMIEEYIASKDFGINVTISQESSLKGTGGALWSARSLLDDYFAVMYGDSYLLEDLNKIYNSYNGSTLVSIYENNYNNNIDIDPITGKVIYDKYNNYHTFIDYGFIIMNKYELRNTFDLDLNGSDYILVDKPFYEIGTFKGIKEFIGYLNELF
jgi:N-acetyl-alpha-D-muramate 1-phosphate uridylyltransferase